MIIEVTLINLFGETGQTLIKYILFSISAEFCLVEQVFIHRFLRKVMQHKYTWKGTDRKKKR